MGMHFSTWRGTRGGGELSRRQFPWRQRLEAAQRRALDGVAGRDRAGRGAEAAFPPSLPARHWRG